MSVFISVCVYLRAFVLACLSNFGWEYCSTFYAGTSRPDVNKDFSCVFKRIQMRTNFV